FSLFHRSGDPPPLFPFPTRRSSDLLVRFARQPLQLSGVDETVTGWAGQQGGRDLGAAVGADGWCRRRGRVVNHLGNLSGCAGVRSEEHTSELQSHLNLVCRLLLEKK